MLNSLLNCAAFNISTIQQFNHSTFRQLNHSTIEQFKKIVGEEFVFADEETLSNYAHDETEQLHYPPEVVLKPRTAEEISAVMKIF